MLRQREWKAKLPLVLTAVQAKLDVVWEGNMRFSRVLQELPGECLSFHSWASYTGGKKMEAGRF